MQATPSLNRGGLGIELPVDFSELDYPLASGFLVRVLTGHINELQGLGFRHRQIQD